VRNNIRYSNHECKCQMSHSSFVLRMCVQEVGHNQWANKWPQYSGLYYKPSPLIYKKEAGQDSPGPCRATSNISCVFNYVLREFLRCPATRIGLQYTDARTAGLDVETISVDETLKPGNFSSRTNHATIAVI
jgi:hypothetical protein